MHILTNFKYGHISKSFQYICNVRVFFFIFSCYILAVSVLPCADKTDCKYQESEISNFATKDHTEHKGDTENCSPFCMCACCEQSVSFILTPITLKNVKVSSIEVFHVYKISLVSETFESIWQPPKIS